MDLTTLTTQDLETLRQEIADELTRRASQSGPVRIDVRKATASGGRVGWLKHVTSINAAAKNGYAFEGEFLASGEQDLPAGALVLEIAPSGSRKSGGKRGYLYEITHGAEDERNGAGWKLLAEVGDWQRESIRLRDLAAARLA